MVREFVDEVGVDKHVEGNVKASRTENTASTSSFGAEGNAIEGVALGVGIFVEAGRGRTVVGSEVLVGLRPYFVDTVEDSLALEFVKALDGILGVDSKALGDVGTCQVCHDFRTAAVA